MVPMCRFSHKSWITTSWVREWLLIVLHRSWPSLYFTLVMFVINQQIYETRCLTAGYAPPARDIGFTVTPDGTVYIFGGIVADVMTKSRETSNDLRMFDPSENTWHLLVNHGQYTPDASIASTLWMASDGNLYIYGGDVLAMNRKSPFRSWYSACIFS